MVQMLALEEDRATLSIATFWKTAISILTLNDEYCYANCRHAECHGTAGCGK
jgi:hypothetical protein